MQAEAKKDDPPLAPAEPIIAEEPEAEAAAAAEVIDTIPP